MLTTFFPLAMANSDCEASGSGVVSSCESEGGASDSADGSVVLGGGGSVASESDDNDRRKNTRKSDGGISNKPGPS